jgi:hypothetical protein
MSVRNGTAVAILCAFCALMAALVTWRTSDVSAADVSERSDAEGHVPQLDASANKDVSPDRDADGSASRGAPPVSAAAVHKTPTVDDVRSKALARVRELDTRLETEQRDEPWASSVEQAAARAAAEIGIITAATTCRSTFCRMRFHHASPRMVWSTMSAHEPFRHGTFAFLGDPKGIVVFFAREGHALPPSEQQEAR